MSFGSAGGEPAVRGNAPGDGSVDYDKMKDVGTVVTHVSTSCADISSGVSNMDIDINKKTGDSTTGDPTVSTGINFQSVLQCF